MTNKLTHFDDAGAARMVNVAEKPETAYDMCKAVDRGTAITDIRLMKKTGGKSGAFERK